MRLLLCLLAALIATASAAAPAAAPLDIAKVLSGHPGFGGYSDLLTKTKIADEINRRRSITVLVLDDAAVGAITALPADVQKRVLAVQVLLDYYDVAKTNALAGKPPASVTTLYQTSGAADQRQGYVNISEVGKWLKLGSAVPDAPQDSEITDILYTKPSDLSVIHISKAIIPPGIEKSSGASPSAAPTGQASAPASAPKAAKAPKAGSPKAASTAPAASPKADTPTAAEAPAAEAPDAEVPAAAETPADAPEADSPKADAPAADAPAADSPAAADGPGSDAGVADDKAGAGRVAAGASAGAAVLAAFMLGL